ncbi:methylamine utilization protein [Pseudoalteromonas shioyasakiensis]|uniref:methylamine utilization protein n=1 Tax=Pseudoalteromonas shioyasakiensis TaxID=1190813 RepID=UPI0021187E38|nr:methylamine utilization protein [Pseudoalteromonas shioyasakiensis]MCQ8879955.1 methylamine utilization protein [Pseudoalteromonas shioyasakiensis]
MIWQGVVTQGIAMLSILLFSAVTLAAELTLKITDQFGAPLANSVVEVTGSVKPPIVADLPVLTMDQVDKHFSPTLLIAQQGQQVNFPNSDNIRHHVYSFSKAKPFQLKLYSGQPEQPVLFDNEGVVVLGCNIHDSMVGYIYVTNSAQTYQSDDTGLVRLNNVSLPVELSFWHPLQSMSLEEKASLAITENTVGSLAIIINIDPPAPRNTFGNKFKANNDQ